MGAISRAGDVSVHVALCETAHVMLTRSAKWSSLKAQALKLAQWRGAKRAKVAILLRFDAVVETVLVNASPQWLSNLTTRF